MANNDVWHAVCTNILGTVTMDCRSKLVSFFIGTIVLCGAFSCQKSGVQAAGENRQDLSSQKILSMDDQKFLVNAEKTAIRQLTWARAAQQTSKSGDVFEFARQVIQQRNASLVDLSRLMQKKQISQPAALREELQLDAANRLQGLKGADFDDEFISLFNAEQEQVLVNFRSAAETAGDPEVRKYAQANLPSLQAESDQAVAIQKKLSEKNKR
jgi:predicted outer membrane protein